MLASWGVAFDAVDVEATPAARQTLASLGVPAVPAVVAGGRAVHGWNPKAVAELVEEARSLRASGYTGVKMAIGRGVQGDLRAIRAIRDGLGDDFTVECPTGSGTRMTLFEVAAEISRRLTATFLRDANGRRPVYGGSAKFQTDPHWRDHILFYEYFHGDNGAGLGASHQTGWTGVVARLMDLFGRMDASELLNTERERVAERLVREQVGGKA